MLNLALTKPTDVEEVMKEVILATSNAGKIAELKELLSPIKVIPQSELNISTPDETGLTFIENAILKARFAASVSGKPALADDSGLVVYALNGEPGIYSSRFAGESATDEENIEKLLKEMKDIPDEQRGAYFYCSMALVRHKYDPAPLIATGIMRGYITRQITGEDGFGYDPVFYIPHEECTAAELPRRIKNQISHRAQALESLRTQWKWI